jgi:YVTN family beta-propeller protein
MKPSMRLSLLATWVLLVACVHAPAAGPAAYAVRETYSLTGPGRWDLLAVDPARHHLFVTRSDHVQVMDTGSGQLLATVDGTDGAHGIALAPPLHRGYVTNGRGNSVTEFDLDTLQRTRDIPVSGQSPDAVQFDEGTGRVFVMNAHSNNASVIDPASGREVATIAFDGNPELVAGDGRGHLFVNIEDKAEVDDIDTRTFQVLHRWPLPGCEEPSGLALDSAHARLFSACQNGVMAITDANDGHPVARIAIGAGPDGAAFDAQAGLAFSPNGKSGTLTLLHEDDPDHFRIVQTVATEPGARTIALDPISHALYLPAARFGPKPADPSQRPEMVPESFRILVVGPAQTAPR